MKYNLLHRALSIILIIVFLITGFILLSNTQEILAGLENQPKLFLTFKFIVLFFSGFSLFILILFQPKKEIIVEKLIKQETVTDDKNENASEVEVNELQLLSEEELNKEADTLFPEHDIKDIDVYTEKLLTNISKKIEIAQGLIYLRDLKDDLFKASGKYAYFSDEPPKDFKEGETLPGQVVKNQQLINIDDIPEGYVTVISGLGTSYPKHLLIVPGIQGDKTQGIIEIASFKVIDKNFENLLQVVANKLVEKIYKASKE